MLRSLYSAVSGVKAHQTYLDVTGNNIANVNTVGFKRDVLQFRDMMYQDIKNASGPNAGTGTGGINPAQVGLGVQVGSIETVHTGGSTQTTGIPTDMAIKGSGFFVVKNGGQTLYTRAGNFALDATGNLVMSGNGNMVQGYQYRDQIDPATGETIRVKDSSLSTINIPMGEKIPAKATQLAAFRCNLCSNETAKIKDLNSIPGGKDQVLRPHMYTAVAGSAVTYVGSGAPDDVTLPGTTGETYYDYDANQLYRWSDTNGGEWSTTNAKGDPLEVTANTVYYGNNETAAGEFTNAVYYNGTEYPVVSRRTSVDQAGATGDRPDLATTPLKAGTTYLDTTTGKIYKVNSTATAWEDAGTSEAGIAYAVKSGTNVGSIYVMGKDADMAASPAEPDFVNTTQVLDSSNGAKNIFSWSGTTWTSINNNPDLSASANSITDQATIDAFGQSMMATNDHEVKVNVFDSLGNTYTMITVFRKVLDRPADPTVPTGAESEWDWYAYYADKDGNVLEQYGEGAGTLVFGDDGLLKKTYYYEATPATPDPAATATTQPEYNWQVVEKEIGNPLHADRSTGKVVADFNVSGAEGSVINGDPLSYASNMIELDFLGEKYAEAMGLAASEPISGVTQYGSETTTKVRYQDGYAMGEMNDFTVSSSGVVTGIYSNGRSIPLYQVALATFQNEQGLQKVGDTCFAETTNSGMAQIGAPQTGSAGSIEANAIEMSNVDLSEEFVNLIRAQRGFQASTRVVTTSDQVLEELINLKR